MHEVKAIAKAEVEARWQVFLDGRCFVARQRPKLKPLITAAAQRPELRQLLPVISMQMMLCFSRSTGVPYTRDTPYVWVLGKGRYRVHAPDATADVPEGTVLGEGDAETAVALVVANLPEGCGPAVVGTAEDFLEDPES